MKEFNQFLVPYLISQAVALGIFLTAWKNTSVARLLFALLFVAASALNMYLGLTNPDTYLVYADMAVPSYRNFINGWFRGYNWLVSELSSFS